MTLKITRFIFRLMSEKTRRHLLVANLMESALVRPGGSIDLHLAFEKDGTHSYYSNGIEWSYPKKDRARNALRSGYSMQDVADAYGVSVSELQNQLLDREMVDRLHEKAAEALLPYCEDGTPATHPVTGLTWDQMKREDRGEHTKGDF